MVEIIINFNESFQSPTTLKLNEVKLPSFELEGKMQFWKTLQMN